jgi:signal transduction histidine kinase/ActR/RegA family two-component response regulator
MAACTDSVEGRVLVLMPTGNDAGHTALLRSEENLPIVTCSDLATLCQELRAGAGAVLLTDEALRLDTSGQLAAAVRAQPTWSAVPFIVVAREDAGRDLEHEASDALLNLIVVERPVHTRTLVSLVLSALRGRRHQYQIRDAIRARERHAAELLEQDERLRFALSAGRLGSWELELATRQMKCSELCKTNFGRPTNLPFSYQDLHQIVHPLDQARVESALARSLATGADYDIEYRVLWPDGTTHWVLVRGRVAYDEAKRPLRMLGVSLDITERKFMHEALQQSEWELARQADQLRTADRRKDEFLATLAHELRNPLAPVRTGLDLLSLSPDPEATKQTLAVMHRQLGHMVRLIDDLLDVSRITRGKLELKREQVSLRSAVDAAVEASRPFIEEKRHSLRVSLPEQAIALHADLTRIAQVISNLLNNASKYSNPGGVIELSARVEAEHAVIEVRDNGIGIPPDSLEDVFEMFSQVNRTLDRSQGGLGIGLALVRRVVEMHGGHVSASSEGLGRGSTFTVRLPHVEQTAQLRTEPSQELGRATTGKLILVVDDNRDAADLLSLMLQHAGHRTLTAEDGPEALAVAAANVPQVIFLDIGMPGMSGYEVARVLRKDVRFAQTALVALTGWGSRDDKRKAMEAGFDFHLTKPVDARDVHGVLAQATEQFAAAERAGLQA